jgi:hypothetical protein
MQPNDIHLTIPQMPWRPFFPGIDFKLLRVSAETGTFTVFFRAAAGATFARHRHLGAGEYYMVKGKMLVRGGQEKGGITAVAGDWGYEPLNMIHDLTEFPEPSEFLFTNHGPIQFIDENDNTVLLLDSAAVQKLAQDA